MNNILKRRIFIIVVQIKEIIPNIALSTDIIIGFPTETEEEFQDTLDVAKQVEFDSALILNIPNAPTLERL